MRRLIWFSVVATFAASSSYAQDISGDWQDSLKAGPQDLRIILNISKPLAYRIEDRTRTS